MTQKFIAMVFPTTIQETREVSALSKRTVGTQKPPRYSRRVEAVQPDVEPGRAARKVAMVARERHQQKPVKYVHQPRHAVKDLEPRGEARTSLIWHATMRTARAWHLTGLVYWYTNQLIYVDAYTYIIQLSTLLPVEVTMCTVSSGTHTSLCLYIYTCH